MDRHRLLLLSLAAVLTLSGCNTLSFYTGQGVGLPCQDDAGCPAGLYCSGDSGLCRKAGSETEQDAGGGGNDTCQETLFAVTACTDPLADCIVLAEDNVCAASQDAFDDLMDCMTSYCTTQCLSDETACNTCVSTSCPAQLSACHDAGC